MGCADIELMFVCPNFLPKSRSNMEREMKERYDNEYRTSSLDELLFLKRNGIRYEWVTKDEDGNSVWKFKKTPKLFTALAKLYGSVKFFRGDINDITNN